MFSGHLCVLLDRPEAPALTVDEMTLDGVNITSERVFAINSRNIVSSSTTSASPLLLTGLARLCSVPVHDYVHVACAKETAAISM